MGTLEGTLLYVGIPIFSPIPLKFRQLCHIFDVKTRMMSLFGRNFDGLGRKFEFKGGKFDLKGRMLSVLGTLALFFVRNWCLEGIRVCSRVPSRGFGALNKTYPIRKLVLQWDLVSNSDRARQ
ncbi:hypothetical protein CA2015_1112 [Cyclobacterium amurskyense]|uniref:Uncharacterized protein n=1 Tax=Cyclobacterium amurskyense TaxID=320787 RepID=A0A0H4P7Y5_9BACT|nr:hypothetical protein CA2015_1112 [Cyclobacterium amurskyense]